ncbi:hypothetical protein IscW_ISCW022601 [Ixodes scapularis]|uniref:Uncharacterized protein n=1 Tax=Ixodes scapularis TaxID=6945 RepID=B7QG78_IXOSC|nr:hypothetical protein IscW_ISCW022601 [Ixodes scapularis]|eukprot:XP_002401259.1 hypothetical protein IscW_ISCW022601 [Ixodes scapularis]
MLQPALALPIPEIRDRHPYQEPVKHGPVQAGPLRRVPGHRYFLLGKEGKLNRGPLSSGPADKSAPPGHPTASDFGPRNRFLRRAMQLAHPGRPPQLLQARKLPSCVAYRAREGHRHPGATERQRCSGRIPEKGLQVVGVALSDFVGASLLSRERRNVGTSAAAGGETKARRRQRQQPCA